MNLLTIAFKSIRQRALASGLTALSVALGIMLMVVVLVVFGMVEDNFSQNSIGYDLIAGPKGSSLELVLATVYRIGYPEGNLPYQYYEDLKKDRRITRAVPITMGDVTEEGGFKIIGTTTEYFEVDYAPDRPFYLEEGGKAFGTSFDAIIGADVKQTNGWDIGTKLKLVHGGLETGHVHDEEFTVVGVLKRTGTANDKTVFVSLDGFFEIGGHDKPIAEAIAQYREFYGPESISAEEEAKLIADEQKEAAAHAGDDHGHHHHGHHVPEIKKNVTAVLVVTRSEIDAPMLEGASKRGYRAQFVNPIKPIRQLMDTIVGNIRRVLFGMTCLIIAVSGVGIFVSIYNSMADRRKEIAIMRALGARRQTVFSIILAESILLCVGGGLLGLLLGHGLVFAAAPYIESYGLLVNPFAFEPLEFVLFPVLIGLAALIGFVPGMTAYRTDVAQALSN